VELSIFNCFIPTKTFDRTMQKKNVCVRAGNRTSVPLTFVFVLGVRTAYVYQTIEKYSWWMLDLILSTIKYSVCCLPPITKVSLLCAYNAYARPNSRLLKVNIVHVVFHWHKYTFLNKYYLKACESRDGSITYRITALCGWGTTQNAIEYFVNTKGDRG